MSYGEFYDEKRHAFAMAALPALIALGHGSTDRANIVAEAFAYADKALDLIGLKPPSGIERRVKG